MLCRDSQIGENSKKWKYYEELDEVFANSSATGHTKDTCSSFMMNEGFETNLVPNTPATL